MTVFRTLVSGILILDICGGASIMNVNEPLVDGVQDVTTDRMFANTVRAVC